MIPRMEDIARDLGVSRGTISKVLRNHPDIADETRERVLARIKELDYSPNLAARTLVTGRTHLVGLIVPTLLYPEFAEIAKSICDAFADNGYSLIVTASDEDPNLEEREVDRLLARRVDTVIVATCHSTVDLFFRIEKRRTPYVLIHCNIPGLSANFVGTNDKAVGELATGHLMDIGCKRIAHISGANSTAARSRLDGYKQTLRHADIRLSDDYIVTGTEHYLEAVRSGSEVMQRLLDLKDPPDGVFCFNDLLAMGAMSCALDRGLRIPEDLAIIGCGNLHTNASLRVPLSSIDQRSREIGEEAARITLSILNSKVPPKPEAVVLCPKLVVRTSTQRAVTKSFGLN